MRPLHVEHGALQSLGEERQARNRRGAGAQGGRRYSPGFSAETHLCGFGGGARIGLRTGLPRKAGGCAGLFGGRESVSLQSALARQQHRRHRGPVTAIL